MKFHKALLVAALVALERKRSKPVCQSIRATAERRWASGWRTPGAGGRA